MKTVYNGFLTTQDKIIAHNARLDQLKVTGARLSGAWIQDRPWARAEVVTRTSAEMRVQLQAKCAHWDRQALKVVQILGQRLEEGANVLVACLRELPGFFFENSRGKFLELQPRLFLQLLLQLGVRTFHFGIRAALQFENQQRAGPTHDYPDQQQHSFHKNSFEMATPQIYILKSVNKLQLIQ